MAVNQPYGKASNKHSSRLSVDDSMIPPFRVFVTKRFLVLSLLSSTLLAFAVGRTARWLLLVRPTLHQIREETLSLLSSSSQGASNRATMLLPSPVLKDKEIPQTLYSAKHFDTARSSTMHSRWVVTDQAPSATSDPVMTAPSSCASDPLQCAPSRSSSDPLNIDLEEEEEEEEVHLPVGQHLLMDIRNVEAAFLDSEERLAQAMLQVVGECGLTLLSYHCHGLDPAGVSCVGVLLESHVSFHTWPWEGVITLDLFTCGPNSLLPIVHNMERLFSVPRGPEHEPPETIWAYKVRGFGDETKEELTDLFTFPIGAMTDYKRQVASETTKFFRVDIYDVLRPNRQSLDSYKRSLNDPSSYEYMYQDVFQPDRILFVNGILQTQRSGEAPYYEALVHPAMFAHPNPRKVAILSGAEGSILREVLKHNTVDEVVVVVEDEALLNLTIQFFPGYHDCSSFLEVSSCLDDPRVRVVYKDLYEWLEDLVGDDETDGVAPNYFDVMIVDDIFYVCGLDNDDCAYIPLVPYALADDGVFAAQVGEAPSIVDPAQDFSKHRSRDLFLETLVEVGFESVRDYDETHSGLEVPWQFVVAFNSFDSRAEWFSNEAFVQLDMRNRAVPTHNGSSPFIYFDEATMNSFIHPTRGSEETFCRSDLDYHEECIDGHGFDPSRPDLPAAEVLEVRSVVRGNKETFAIFAKTDIPSSAYVGLGDLVHSISFPVWTFDVIFEMHMFTLRNGLPPAVPWMFCSKYGSESSYGGYVDAWIDPSLQMFVQHGCDGASNFGFHLNLLEGSVSKEVIPNEILYYKESTYAYHPAAERQPNISPLSIPTRDIAKGEEILVNFLAYSGQDLRMWGQDVSDILSSCLQVGEEENVDDDDDEEDDDEEEESGGRDGEL